MRHAIFDQKYHFFSFFNSLSGGYMRTGIIDSEGKDTGVDPFMASFPHLIDVGIMGHCIHGRSGLCEKAGVACYQNGPYAEEPSDEQNSWKEQPANKANGNQKSLGRLKGAKTIAR